MTPHEFERFFLLVYPQLVRYVRRFYNPAVAEDLAAETMEHLWKNDESTQPSKHSFNQLRKFAFSVLRRKIGHHVRSETSRHRREKNFSSEQVTQARTPDISDKATEPDWPEWVTKLRTEERTLLDMYARHDKPADIALALGITPAAVSARLQRLKKKIHKLQHEENGGDDEHPHH